MNPVDRPNRRGIRHQVGWGCFWVMVLLAVVGAPVVAGWLILPAVVLTYSSPWWVSWIALRRVRRDAEVRITSALQQAVRVPTIEPADLEGLGFAELVGDVLAPVLLAYKEQMIQLATTLMALPPTLPETEITLRTVEAAVRQPVPPDEVARYRERLADSEKEGFYTLELTSLADGTFDSKRLLACVAFLGMSFDEAEQLQKSIEHVGPKRVREGIGLDDAVRLKGLMQWFGFEVKINERANAKSRDDRNRPSIPEAVRHEVWRRDEGKCVDCGTREKLEFDHIIPFSKGGSNTARNLELRCEGCNRAKSDKI